MGEVLRELGYAVYDMVCGKCPNEKKCHVFEGFSIVEYNEKIIDCVCEKLGLLEKLLEKKKKEKVTFT